MKNGTVHRARVREGRAGVEGRRRRGVDLTAREQVTCNDCCVCDMGVKEIEWQVVVVA
jgi:hypothetical protein